MDDFDRLLNWKLLSGSHDFPGPDGGTCINEAAVVAAGFAYREIDSILKLPKCFSPVLSAFAMELNDTMPDDERQKLLPFVMRLAGARDRPTVENARGDFIFARWIDRVLPMMLDIIDLRTEADSLRRKQSLESARRRTLQIAKIALDRRGPRPDHWYNHCLVTAAMCERAASVRSFTRGNLIVCPDTIVVGDTSIYMGDAIYRRALTEAGIWDPATEILDQAMQIGRRAEPVEIAEIERRFETQKTGAQARRELMLAD